MLFTSYEFIGFVLILLLVYYCIPQKYQWLLLLAASYIFYFISGPAYLVYIMVTTITTWVAARRIEKNADRQREYLKVHKDELSQGEKRIYKEQQKRIRGRWKIMCIVINVGILAAVKYTNFLIDNINHIFAVFGQEEKLSFFSLALPLGISFYTFQAMGYLIDVYRGTVPAEKNIFRFALFVSFFPQLVQGPISRFGELSKTLYERHPFDSRAVGYGLQRVLWGFFKKLVIADRVLVGVTTILSDMGTYHGAYIFVGMVFYMVQLYADFTGGIDITIGIAQALGITLPENFCRPYFSKSLKEYWRRWHISLGAWFRDYIFYPVSTSKLMQKFSRFSRKKFGAAIGKHLPVYLSSFMVWITTGIWHGASWNFILWGLGNWLVLMVSEGLEPLYARFHQRFHWNTHMAYRLFQIGRTLMILCCLKLLVCYSSAAEAFRAFGSVLTASNWNILWNGGLLDIGLTVTDYGILIGGILLLLIVSILQRSGGVRDRIAGRPYPVRFALYFGMFLIVLLMGAYGAGYDASQFIYNRF